MTFAHDVVQHFSVFTDPNGFNEIGLIWFSVPLMIGLSTCIPVYIIFHRPLTTMCLCYHEISVSALAQGFYCYRAAILTKSKYAVCLIGMVVIHNKCCSPAASAHCAEFPCFSEQLSLCQLGAAIALALEAKEAAVATKLYATNRTFITIGVSIFFSWSGNLFSFLLSFVLYRSGG